MKRVGLYLNVVRPTGVSAGTNLPVVVVSWVVYFVLLCYNSRIYGGSASKQSLSTQISLEFRWF